MRYEAPVGFVPYEFGNSSEYTAYEVVGDFAPNGVSFNGWIVVVANERLEPSDDLLGMPVIVKQPDTQPHYKTILPGSKPGLYSLKSSIQPLMVPDAEIEWVQRVEWCKPGKM